MTVAPDTCATWSVSQVPTLSTTPWVPCRSISSTSSPGSRQPGDGAGSTVALLAASAVTGNAGLSAQLRPGVSAVCERLTVPLTTVLMAQTPSAQTPASHGVPSATGVD